MASSQPRSSWPVIVTIVAALCLLVTLPNDMKRFLPGFLKPSLHLGLDLAGGTQLDFRISEDEINARKEEIAAKIKEAKEAGNTKEIDSLTFELQSTEQQHAKLVEAIRTVLERRINSLGVSEATITPSYFGDEKHLLVECPGVIDVNRCIQTVGKTIQLEFKEEYSGSSEAYASTMRARAEKVYRAVTTGTGNLQVYGQDLSSVLGVSYFENRPVFVSQLPKGLEAAANRKPTDPVLKTEASIQTAGQNEQGETVLKEIKGIYLTKVLEGRKPVARPLTDPAEALAELSKATKGSSIETKNGVNPSAAPAEIQGMIASMAIGAQNVVKMPQGTSIVYLAGRTEGTEQMTASHILIQYKGADRADATVTRSKEQAKSLIDDIAKRLKGGANFETIARTESDGPSKTKNGSLGVLTRGMMVEPFELAAFSLKQGQLSAVIETPFGYHIIRADKAASKSGGTVSYTLLRLPEQDEAAATAMIKKVEGGEVAKTEDQIVLQSLFFSLEPTGWKDTELNGQRFRTAAVSMDPVTNIPVVQIQFDEKGGQMFQEMTKRNIGKQIAIFVGGELVSAPTVQNEIIGGNAVITGSRNFEEANKLAQDLNTGAIPAPIYLSGQTTVEATLGTNALEKSVFAAGVGIIVLCLVMIAIYRLLGVVASIALILYVIFLVAAMKLPILLISKQHIVLTLAGIAGMILSMGMAVDANVLAFERIKEELRKGKMLKTAVETGFKKAWPSVRDGNFSTLITCGILFMIGTSIIRGFAITLSIGILISLFTGVVVSRWLCRKIAETPLANRPELFGVKIEKPTESGIIQR